MNAEKLQAENTEQQVKISNQERTITNQQNTIKRLTGLNLDLLRLIHTEQDTIQKFVNKEKLGIKVLDNGSWAV